MRRVAGRPMPAATQPSTRSAPALRRRLPFRKIPILVNSFNRLDCLRGLVDWLRGAGYADIIIIDNASSFPPLLSYLERLEAALVAEKQGSSVRPSHST